MDTTNTQTLRVKISGVAPLILHNARLCDPLDEFARALKKVSSKRSKTDADHEQMAEIEYRGGLYVTDDDRPAVPGGNIERMLRDAAAKQKLGKQVISGLIVPGDDDGMVPLIYDGPSKASKLNAKSQWSKRSTVKVGQARVMRTRPCFRTWGLEFDVIFAIDVLEADQIEEFVSVAGQIIGLGDWRPKHGRFAVESIKEV